MPMTVVSKGILDYASPAATATLVMTMRFVLSNGVAGYAATKKEDGGDARPYKEEVGRRFASLRSRNAGTEARVHTSPAYSSTSTSSPRSALAAATIFSCVCAGTTS
jgi:hypothetical protein